jgi:hypothetical protein
MPVPPKNQLSTVTPFSPRDWVTICRDYAVLHPDLDFSDPGDTVLNALKKPLRGEKVLMDDPNSVGGSWWRNRTIRDENFLDSGFQVTRNDATHINVTSGACMCCGIYLAVQDATTTISLGDSTSFLTIDSTSAYPPLADTAYYLAIVPDDTTTIGLGSGFGFALIIADAWDEHVFMNHDMDDFATLLAVVTLNSIGQIQDSSSITFSRFTQEGYVWMMIDWNREELAFPPCPSFDPLNGGVLIGTNWWEDWDSVPPIPI